MSNKVNEWDTGFNTCLMEVLMGMAKVYSLADSLDDSLKHGGYISSAMRGKYIKWDKLKQNYAITKKGLKFLQQGEKYE